uniref:Sugar O-methyltransferase n=1 Tax=viral metagenome TaxID=1070528 RepID=A0A6M3LDX4_9ZZZZ
MWNYLNIGGGKYLTVCETAVFHDNNFNRFRHLFDYCAVVETCSEALGREYYQKIVELIGEQQAQKDWPVWVENDLYGGPKKITIDTLGEIAPTTLRYAYVAYHLRAIFGDLKRMNICEIGGGYGGQARMLSGLFGCADLTLIDLWPPLMLARKYLALYGMTPAMYTAGAVGDIELHPDLLISNYAFSELDIAEQEIYYQNIVKNADRVYLVYNNTPGATPIKTMQTRLQNSIIIAEGITASRSGIIIGGKNGIGYTCQS